MASSLETSSLFLGLDLSTQGLKAVLITEDGQVAHESAVNFDKELPHYGTTNGAIKGPDEGEVTSPVKMWLEAMDLIVTKMKNAGVDLSRIMAVSGDGQVRHAVTCLHTTLTYDFAAATWLCLLVIRCRAPPMHSESHPGARRTIVPLGIYLPALSHLARLVHHSRLS